MAESEEELKSLLMRVNEENEKAEVKLTFILAFTILLLPFISLQSQSAVNLEPKKRKSFIASTFSISICHEMIGLDAAILVCFFFFLNTEF